jgi:hypothetical protein
MVMHGFKILHVAPVLSICIKTNCFFVLFWGASSYNFASTFSPRELISHHQNFQEDVLSSNQLPRQLGWMR